MGGSIGEEREGRMEGGSVRVEVGRAREWGLGAFGGSPLSRRSVSSAPVARLRPPLRTCRSRRSRRAIGAPVPTPLPPAPPPTPPPPPRPSFQACSCVIDGPVATAGPCRPRAASAPGRAGPRRHCGPPRAGRPDPGSGEYKHNLPIQLSLAEHVHRRATAGTVSEPAARTLSHGAAAGAESDLPGIRKDIL